MMNQQLENKLQTIQPTTVCKYVIVACVGIFTMVLALQYYYNPLGVSNGGKFFGSSTNHSSELDLGRLLEKVSMPNKTLIITTINAAWAEHNSLLDLYLHSFQIGEGTQQLMENLLLVAVDQKAFERCQQIHPHCYLLLNKGSDFSGEKVFMTQDYLDLMWARILFLKHVLVLGYNFVFSDTDIMWFRNPFQLLDENADFQIACDNYVGDPHNMSNAVNGGFNFVRSNGRSIEFYEWWYESRSSYPNMHDQGVLNEIKSEKRMSEIGLKMLFLDTKYFSGFCQQRASLRDVVTMHANCCIGMNAKLADLTLILQDWASFRSPNASLTTQVHWRAPNSCFH